MPRPPNIAFHTFPSLCTSSLGLRALVAHDGRRPSRYADVRLRLLLLFDGVERRVDPAVGRVRASRCAVLMVLLGAWLGAWSAIWVAAWLCKLPLPMRWPMAREMLPGALRVARIARRWSCVPFVLCCSAPGSPPCNANPAGPVDAVCVLPSLAWLRASGLLVYAYCSVAASDRAVLLACWGVRGAHALGIHPGVLLCKPWLPLLRLLRLCVRVARSGLAACFRRVRASAPVPVFRASCVVRACARGPKACWLCIGLLRAAWQCAPSVGPPSPRSCDPDALASHCLAGCSLRGAAASWWGAVLVFYLVASERCVACLSVVRLRA